MFIDDLMMIDVYGCLWMISDDFGFVWVVMKYFGILLGPGCNNCRLQNLVPDGGVPCGKAHMGIT